MSPYTLVPRGDWGEVPEPKQMVRLRTPVEAVFFGYTSKDYTRYGAKESPGAYPNREQTLRELRFIARGDQHFQPDTRYNFLIGNDGCVYEGRGWLYRPFLPTYYVTPPYFYGIYITFIGDFREFPPSDTMLQLRNEFLKDGVRKGNIRERFTFIAMKSPGSGFKKQSLWKSELY